MENKYNTTKFINAAAIAILFITFSVVTTFAKESRMTPSGKIEVSFYGANDQNRVPYSFRLSNFPEEAKVALVEAMAIVEESIELNHTMQVGFGWSADLEKQKVLGLAYCNFVSIGNIPGLAHLDNNYKYPAELAYQLSGSILYEGENITILFNAKKDWCMSSVEEPKWYEQDLITVALHEMTHGLGLSSSFTKSSESKPYIFDKYVRNEYGEGLTASYSALKSSAKTCLTDIELFYEGDNGVKSNNYEPIKLHVPEAFSSSSICHFDMEYANDENSRLMIAGTAYGISTRQFGNFALGIFEDLGWTVKENETLRADNITKGKKTLTRSSVTTNTHNNMLPSSIKMWSSNGTIFVETEGFTREEVMVYNAFGRLIAQQTVNGYASINVEPNHLYIVKAAGKVEKMMVK